jgi:hypothetical protein
MKVAIARRHRGAHWPFRVGCVDTGSRNLCHPPFPRGNCSPDADGVQLEELAFRLAAKQLTPAIEAELRSHLKALNASAKAKDHFAAAEGELKFHEAVWRASGNPVLERGRMHRLCFLCVCRSQIACGWRRRVPPTSPGCTVERKGSLPLNPRTP